ncbi:D-alanyl-D-alanine carboxypeptidase family protein [Selenomonas sputigena]|uniref:D-alanyl-D-alanine carboxypeptidase family protein n=1 Tax=Selenomonas sputigena TaxID=69823 RepID=UPI0028EEC68F|nr:D-alanyl-D-alanine carboxypeptidase family protein [Selenomonas sputigena]
MRRLGHRALRRTAAALALSYALTGGVPALAAHAPVAVGERAHDVGQTEVHTEPQHAGSARRTIAFGKPSRKNAPNAAPAIPEAALPDAAPAASPTPSVPPTALAAPPASVRSMTADAAILMNAKTGEVLYEKNGDKREYPASMTKMMTCILSVESGRADLAVTITPFAADVETTRVRPGEQARLRDLTRQMMLISDNGAALAIAETLGGSEAQFAAMMNRKAREIGAFHTHFVNPNGMPDANHYSTAHDIALIAAYGLRNPEFRKIVGTKASTIYYLQPAGYKTYCENTNALLYSYPGCTGLKTGWTRAAGGCLAASAMRGDTELIAVVMHSDDEDTRASEAAALLDYGFSALAEGGKQERS